MPDTYEPEDSTASALDSLFCGVESALCPQKKSEELI